jgi:IS30 family transposase
MCLPKTLRHETTRRYRAGDSERTIGHLRPVPAHAVASDTGSEFTWHYRLADTIGVLTYFADPYTAWQRGTNQDFNGRIRKYLPKRTSFVDLDQAELNEISTEINNRPRRVLGWASAGGVFNEPCSQQATHTCCTSD